MICLTPLHTCFAAEVHGLDLCSPLADDVIADILRAIDEYAVLVFRGQVLSDEQQVRFSQCLGELERSGQLSNITRDEDRRLSREIGDLSNLDRHASLLGRHDRQRMFNLGNRLWHSDSSYKVIPAKFSLLSARRLPNTGGDTQFADMREAYESLDNRTRERIGDLICEHSLMFSRGVLGFDAELTEAERLNFRPVRQRLIRTLSSTGRRSLFLSAHAGDIIGWPTPEARALLLELTEHATRPERVYTHRWALHDLVMWDNRQTMHRVRPFDDLAEVRDMHRTTVAGDEPTVAQ